MKYWYQQGQANCGCAGSRVFQNIPNHFQIMQESHTEITNSAEMLQLLQIEAMEMVMLPPSRVTSWGRIRAYPGR